MLLHQNSRSNIREDDRCISTIIEMNSLDLLCTNKLLNELCEMVAVTLEEEPALHERKTTSCPGWRSHGLDNFVRVEGIAACIDYKAESSRNTIFLLLGENAMESLSVFSMLEDDTHITLVGLSVDAEVDASQGAFMDGVRDHLESDVVWNVDEEDDAHELLFRLGVGGSDGGDGGDTADGVQARGPVLSVCRIGVNGTVCEVGSINDVGP